MISGGFRNECFFSGRLELPVIAAPMFRVSGPELVISACRAGIIGSFPSLNCQSVEELDHWLTQIEDELSLSEGERAASPYAVNLIVNHPRLQDDLDCLLRHKPELVITSVGSPARLVEPLHSIGCKVVADVASLDHARKAVDAKVDGLVLLTAGAGGQTGWANPFAFIEAVRAFFDGPVILAGGVGSGRAVHAAEILGYDLAYVGTGFLASKESMASPLYKQMVLEASIDDIVTTSAMTGIPANLLRSSIARAGLDPDNLIQAFARRAERARGDPTQSPREWQDIWSAGHSVASVTSIETVEQIVGRMRGEYEAVASAQGMKDRRRQSL